MTAIPGHSETFLDGQLGISGGNAEWVRVFAGTCQSGTVNTLYGPYRSPKAIRDVHGYGPAPEAAALSSGLAGGVIYILPLTKTNAGACGSVTAVQTGTATLVGSGAAYDTYSVIATIIAGGATLVAATASFKYSIDGGDNYSAEIALPASGVYVIPGTNVTLTWTYSSGTAFVAGDSFTFATTAPGYAAADVTSGFTAFRALVESGEVDYAVLTGRAASASASATIAAALGTEMDAFETAHRFFGCFMFCGQDTDANIGTAFASFVNDRVLVVAGEGEIISKLTGTQNRRNVGEVIEPKVAKGRASDHPGYVNNGAGALSSALADIYRDEQATEVLSDKRFITVRRIDGYAGFFVTDFWTMAAKGSDYAPGNNRLVMDRVARTARKAAIGYCLNKTIKVEKATKNGQANPRAGYILEDQAQDIEATIRAALKPLEADVSELQVSVARDDNILSTATLNFTYRVTPVGYAKQLVGNFGFNNPAIAS